MKMCTLAGFNNSIGSIARNGHWAMVFGSDVTHQICIVEYSGNPFFRTISELYIHIEEKNGRHFANNIFKCVFFNETF